MPSYRVQTTTEGARAISGLIDDARGTSDIGNRPGPPLGGLKPVVVRILSDIAADDGRQYDAALMSLVGTNWTDTMQRVAIRNISTGTLRTNDRHIATPCGNLGLCVEALFET